MSDLFGGYPQSANNVINLDWILQKVKEFSDELETVEARALAVAKEYTDKAIADSLQEYTEKLLAFEDQVNTEIANIKKSNAEFKTEINLRFTTFEGEINLTIDEFKNYINTRVGGLEIRVNSLYSYVDIQNKELETRLKAYIENQVIDVRVINYFTGEKVTTQQMFDYLSSLHVNNGLTYTQLITDYNNVTFTMLDNYCLNQNVSYTDLTLEFKTIMDTLQP